MLNKMMEVAGECGQMILSAKAANGEISSKTSWRDLVTVYDKQVQDHAVRALHDAFPGKGFICEESDDPQSAPIQGGGCFIIDPIDGTLNFIHQYAHSCTSIAYVENGVPVIGVVYDPYRDEMFTAERGKGAYLNGVQIRATDAGPEDSVVLFGTTPYNLDLADDTMEMVRSVYGRCLDVRRSGSAALDLCYVACGRAGLYFELELSVWDYAAGALIVEESGGVCKTADGGRLPFGRPLKSSCVAGTGKTLGLFYRG